MGRCQARLCGKILIEPTSSLAKPIYCRCCPSLEEYPLSVPAYDSNEIEMVEIFHLLGKKRAKVGDGFYNEMARSFNQQQVQISNGKKAAVANSENRLRSRCSVYPRQPFTFRMPFHPVTFYGAICYRPMGSKWIPLAKPPPPNTAGIIVKKVSGRGNPPPMESWISQNYSPASPVARLRWDIPIPISPAPDSTFSC